MQQTGKIVPMLIQQNEKLDFEQLGGAHHITITNRGNTTIRIMGIDDIAPDEVFSVDVDFAIVNKDFGIEFLTIGIGNPINRAMLWYGRKNKL